MVRMALKEARKRAASVTRPVCVAPGKALGCKPQTVHDVVASVRAQSEVRGLKGRETAAFVKDFLEADEQREVSRRGDKVQDDHQAIFVVRTALPYIILPTVYV